MENKIMKIDPKEYGLNENQVSEIEKAFLPKIQERDGYSEIYGELIKKEITIETEKEARDLRLKLVKVRTGIAEIHKTQKAFFLAAGRFVDAWKNKETAPIEQMEENLSGIENYRANIEKERIAKLSEERKIEVGKWSDVVPEGLGIMDQSVFDNYLSGLKVAYKARIDAEKKAEEERLAREKAEAEERERIRIENEILKKEAEEREKQRQKELAEQKKKEEIARKEREKLEAEKMAIEEKARIERENAEAERLKLEREIQQRKDAEEKARKDAEAKAETERKAKEAEERKAAKAPDKKKLEIMIESIQISIPEMKTKEGEQVKNYILEKFNGFKSWSKSQITNL